MGLLNDLWQQADFWDKEENAKQKVASTVKRAQNTPPAQTVTKPNSLVGRNDNQPGFQITNNSLTRGLSRGFDQANVFDSGRSWQTRQPKVFKSSVQSGGDVVKAVGKPFWELADAAGQLPGALHGRHNGFKESLDQSIVGGVGRFGQSVASGALTPVSNFYADQERKRAERLLTPAYSNLYKAYGQDPRLGELQAQVEAGEADYNLRTDPLNRSNIGVNDSLGTTTRKVAAQGAEALLDMATLPAVGRAVTTSLVKNPGKQFVKNTVASGALGASGNMLYTAQQEGSTPLDYAKQGALGLGAGVAMPVSTRLVSKGARSALNTANKVDNTLPFTPRGRVNVEEQNILRDYSDMLAGAYNPKGKDLSDLIGQAQQIGRKYGTDLTNGSVEQRLYNSNGILDNIGKKQLGSKPVYADFDPTKGAVGKDVNKGVGASKLSPEAQELMTTVKQKVPDIDESETMRLAKTIASKESSDIVQASHLAEAVQYRDIADINEIRLINLDSPSAIARYNRATEVGVKGLDPELGKVFKSVNENMASLPKDAQELLNGAISRIPEKLKISKNYADGTANTLGLKRINEIIDIARKDAIEVGNKEVSQGNIAKALSDVMKPKPTQPIGVGKPKSTLQDALDGKSTKPKGFIIKESKPVGGRVDTVRVHRGEDGQLKQTVQSETRDTTKAALQNDDMVSLGELVEREYGFNAVAGARGTKNADRLVKAINNNGEVTDAIKKAQFDGDEINFFAKKDANDRSVGVERFDPRYHDIEAGFVTDKNGNVLGNHIKVDETGIQVNVGGKLVNMESVIGDATNWNDSYKVTETMDRNLERMAPNKAVYKQSRDFLINHKTKADANFRTELKATRDNLSANSRDVMKSKPRGVGDEIYKSDIFDFIEGKLNDNDIRTAYGGEAASKITDFKSNTRQLYDSLLEKVNTEFIKFGMEPVPRRKDYLTHIQELSANKSFAGQIYDDLHNSIVGEASGKTRGAIPGDIAGRSENFKPEKKYNPFFQERKGSKHAKDPFRAIDAYIEPTLYNIHMTESSVRARSVEAAFRTAEVLKKVKPQEISETLNESFDKYRRTESGGMVTAFQEYANALAGKSQRWDRQIVDASKGTRKALQGWQGLQRVAGQSTILGNAQSVIAQSLNQPAVLADTGVKNYVKGIVKSLSKDPSIEQSNFIKARRTDASSQIKSKGKVVLDAGGVPLQKAELAFVELTWHTEHQAALSKGLKGKQAILEADRKTERAVAGRGIADKPEIYRSTATNGLLQYTLEVAAQNKLFWKDFTPAQKAKYVGAAFAMNSLVGAVTGFTPLPDYLQATLDSGRDFLEDDKRPIQNKVGATVQRFAGETASMNPFATAAANSLPQSTRRNLFGSNSDLGRYDGVSAPVKVVNNAVDAGSNLVQGKFRQARDSALKDVPFGNQIRKTTQGAEMIGRGYAIDSSGNPTYKAPSTVTGMGKALLFGPSATGDAKKFYSENNRGLTKDQTEQLKALPKEQRQMFIDRIQKQRDDKAAKKAGKSTGSDTTSPDVANLPTGQRYKKQLDMLEKGDISADEFQKTVEEIKPKIKELELDGLPIPTNSHTARIYANYLESVEKNKGSKISASQDKKEVTKKLYRTLLEGDSGEIYDLAGKSNTALKQAVEDKLIKKDQMDEVIKLDNWFVSKGLSSKPTIGNTLRKELGYDKVYAKGSEPKGKKGRKGRKGRKGKKLDYKMFGFGSSGIATTQSLRKILENATLKG